jgi:hypothetical protein
MNLGNSGGGTFRVLDFRPWAAFRAGISTMLSSYLVPFVILGVLGFRKYPWLPLIAAVYAVMHYVALPNYQERWFAISYLLCAIAAFTSASARASTTGTDRSVDEVRSEKIFSRQWMNSRLSMSA